MTARDFTERDIHLALDGELPDEERVAFETWLENNPEMKARSNRFSADREALRGALSATLDESVPARFTKLIAGDGGRRPPLRSRWWQAAAAAALLAMGGTGGYVVGSRGIGMEDPSADRFAEEAVAAYVVYAAEKRHAVEVPASDGEHMRNWLSARIGLRLVTPDLTADGFQLVGGRLLPSGTGKAAMLLYEDAEGNRISLFVTSESGSYAKGTYAEKNGPTAVYWLDKGYGCAVVGSLPQERLAIVARNAYRQLIEGVESKV
ncbi:MAG TPA: anti-sigma factor [Mesorhizobium sp.]|jgi:anti-sigma factor RsiW|uniref:anti-sigma factor family protein n=1 Tax=Mesorhizobium sp. TaxID=1871066 RepID=UPI002DDCD2E6|nr:anti-sigma factor [Mesorhizobium sp.]HEV2503328.1 anti-sigma factor [Mesorhizobium sp.]